MYKDNETMKQSKKKRSKGKEGKQRRGEQQRDIYILEIVWSRVNNTDRNNILFL
jgi:hypothetical protein